MKNFGTLPAQNLQGTNDLAHARQDEARSVTVTWPELRAGLVSNGGAELAPRFKLDIQKKPSMANNQISQFSRSTTTVCVSTSSRDSPPGYDVVRCNHFHTTHHAA